jgi:hypothetical protein
MTIPDIVPHSSEAADRAASRVIADFVKLVH